MEQTQWWGWSVAGFLAICCTGLYIKHSVDTAVAKVRQDHCRAILHSLQAMRSCLVEAVENGEVINTAETRQFARQMAYNLMGIEAHAMTAANIKPQTQEHAECS